MTNISIRKFTACWTMVIVLTLLTGCKNPLGDSDHRDSSFGPGLGGPSIDVPEDDTPPTPASALTLEKLWVTGSLPAQSPLFTWSNLNEPGSISEVALGLSIGGQEVLSYQPSQADESHSFSNLSLIECSVSCYPSIRFVNRQGIRSTVSVMSQGFRYDNTPPTAVSNVDIPTFDASSTEAVGVSWSAFPGADNCGISHYEIAIGYDDDGDGFDSGDLENEVPWSEVPGGSAINSYKVRDGIDGFTFNTEFNRQYFTSIRVVDSAGLTSNITTSEGWYRFSPMQFTDLEIWLDSSDHSTLFQNSACSTPSVALNDPIGCWQDKSGNLNHALQSAGHTPRLGTAGVDFDGVDDILTVAGKTYTSVSDLSVLVLYEADIQSLDAGSCCRPIVSFATNAGGVYPWLALTRGNLAPANHFIFGWNGSAINPQITAPGDLLLASATHDGTNGLWNAFLDGLNGASNYPLTAYTATPFNVGGDSGSAPRKIRGEILEVVVIESVLNNTERLKVEGYLACKYDSRDRLYPAHPYYALIGANKTGCP